MYESAAGKYLCTVKFHSCVGEGAADRKPYVPTHLKLYRLSWLSEVGVGQDEGYVNDLHWSPYLPCFFSFLKP